MGSCLLVSLVRVATRSFLRGYLHAPLPASSPLSVNLSHQFSKVKFLTTSAPQLVEAVKDSTVVTLDATQTMIRPTHVVGTMPAAHTHTQACDACHCCRVRACLMLMCHTAACAVVPSCFLLVLWWPHGAPTLMFVRLLGGCETCSP